MWSPTVAASRPEAPTRSSSLRLCRSLHPLWNAAHRNPIPTRPHKRPAVDQRSFPHVLPRATADECPHPPIAIAYHLPGRKGQWVLANCIRTTACAALVPDTDPESWRLVASQYGPTGVSSVASHPALLPSLCAFPPRPNPPTPMRQKRHNARNINPPVRKQHNHKLLHRVVH